MEKEEKFKESGLHGIPDELLAITVIIGLLVIVSIAVSYGMLAFFAVGFLLVFTCWTAMFYRNYGRGRKAGESRRLALLGAFVRTVFEFGG